MQYNYYILTLLTFIAPLYAARIKDPNSNNQYLANPETYNQRRKISPEYINNYQPFNNHKYRYNPRQNNCYYGRHNHSNHNNNNSHNRPYTNHNNQYVNKKNESFTGNIKKIYSDFKSVYCSSNSLTQELIERYFGEKNAAQANEVFEILNMLWCHSYKKLNPQYYYRLLGTENKKKNNEKVYLICTKNNENFSYFAIKKESELKNHPILKNIDFEAQLNRKTQPYAKFECSKSILLSKQGPINYYVGCEKIKILKENNRQIAKVKNVNPKNTIKENKDRSKTNKKDFCNGSNTGRSINRSKNINRYKSTYDGYWIKWFFEIDKSYSNENQKRKNGKPNDAYMIRNYLQEYYNYDKNCSGDGMAYVKIAQSINKNTYIVCIPHWEHLYKYLKLSKGTRNRTQRFIGDFNNVKYKMSSLFTIEKCLKSKENFYYEKKEDLESDNCFETFKIKAGKYAVAVSIEGERQEVKKLMKSTNHNHENKIYTTYYKENLFKQYSTVRYHYTKKGGFSGINPYLNNNENHYPQNDVSANQINIPSVSNTCVTLPSVGTNQTYCSTQYINNSNNAVNNDGQNDVPKNQTNIPSISNTFLSLPSVGTTNQTYCSTQYINNNNNEFNNNGQNDVPENQTDIPSISNTFLSLPSVGTNQTYCSTQYINNSNNAVNNDAKNTNPNQSWFLGVDTPSISNMPIGDLPPLPSVKNPSIPQSLLGGNLLSIPNLTIPDNASYFSNQTLQNNNGNSDTSNSKGDQQSYSDQTRTYTKKNNLQTHFSSTNLNNTQDYTNNSIEECSVLSFLNGSVPNTESVLSFSAIPQNNNDMNSMLPNLFNRNNINNKPKKQVYPKYQRNYSRQNTTHHNNNTHSSYSNSNAVNTHFNKAKSHNFNRRSNLNCNSSNIVYTNNNTYTNCYGNNSNSSNHL